MKEPLKQRRILLMLNMVAQKGQNPHGLVIGKKMAGVVIFNKGRMMKRIFSFVAMMILLMGIGFSFPAQAETDRFVSMDELDGLINTLENKQEREKLVQSLRTLAESKLLQQKVAEQNPLFSSRMITVALDGVHQEFQNLIGLVAQIPDIFSWVDSQIQSPQNRQAWGQVLMYLLGMFTAGFLLHFLVHKYLVPRAINKRKAAQNIWLFFWHVAVETLPIIALGVGVYGTLIFANPDELTASISTIWINSVLIVLGVQAVMELALSPRQQFPRLLPLQDETSYYLVIWARRFARLAIYGQAILLTAFYAGLNIDDFESLQRLLFFVLSMMGVVFVLQNRKDVRDWLQKRAKKSSSGLTSLINGLASLWHVVASLYILALYGVWAAGLQTGFDYVLQSTLISFLVIVVAGLVLNLISRGMHKFFALSDDLKTRFPGLEARSNMYVPFLNVVARVLVGMLTFLALFEAWGIGSFEWVFSPTGQYVLGKGTRILLIVVLAIFMWESLNSLMAKLLRKSHGRGRSENRLKTLLPMFKTTSMVLITVFAGLMVLSELGVNIGPLLAGAGVLGVAVGFGSQTLVKDLITGMFILMEDIISIGDVVSISGHTGMVEKIGIRNVHLRDLHGNLYSIPWSSVTSTTNLTKDFAYAVIDAGVGYSENVDDVMTVLTKIGQQLRKDKNWNEKILDDVEVLGVQTLGDSAVTIRLRIKVQPMERWAVMREFNRRMKLKFDEMGIEIPFPHQTVYFGADKKGQAPVTVKLKK